MQVEPKCSPFRNISILVRTCDAQKSKKTQTNTNLCSDVQSFACSYLTWLRSDWTTNLKNLTDASSLGTEQHVCVCVCVCVYLWLWGWGGPWRQQQCRRTWCWCCDPSVQRCRVCWEPKLEAAGSRWLFPTREQRHREEDCHKLFCHCYTVFCCITY